MRRQIHRPTEEERCLQYLMQCPGEWVVVSEMGKKLNIHPRTIGKYLSYSPVAIERKVIGKYPCGCDVLYRYNEEKK